MQSDKDSQDGRDTAHQTHNNVTERRNESMEKTHNPHYKGSGVSFYDTCDWRTIMHSLIPSKSQQPASWRLNLCGANGISRSKQEHVVFLCFPVTLLSHSSFLHYIKHRTDRLSHVREEQWASFNHIVLSLPKGPKKSPSDPEKNCGTTP